LKIDDTRWQQKLAEGSNGNVLVVGLGLNLVVSELDKNEKVASVTRIERSDFWDFVENDDVERDTILVNLGEKPLLKEAMPAYFTLRNKYPKAVIGIYGCQETSDINVGKVCRGEGETRPYGYQVLRGAMRDYVKDKIKAPLMAKMIDLANEYPEPMRVNCLHPNSHILFDIRDKFFEYEDNPCRKALFEAIWKLFIAEYEHDPYYRYRIDWVLEQIMDSDWRPRKIRQEQCWRELD